MDCSWIEPDCDRLYEAAYGSEAIEIKAFRSVPSAAVAKNLKLGETPLPVL
jgi:hypothetical protein